eukprot:TRINITY_DN35845_c0_g1_i1.p1 TRINITY_DN35845_c0_g1~~TRINITY_DN35845_c0_g1_i1.p1  ORF type:complete len:211 (+),score=17.44 TRINITY_DN35845_c0_g1_i1:53-685(+)
MAAPTEHPMDLTVSNNCSKIAYIIENAFTPEECTDLLHCSLQALHPENNVSAHELEQLDCATGQDTIRLFYEPNDNPTDVSQRFFSRVKEFLPPEMDGGKLVGPHAKVRLLTYDEPEFLHPHYDKGEQTETARTHLTVQLYLTENFEGGQTRFIDPAREETDSPESVGDDVVPKVGRVVVHDHDIYHCGMTVFGGRKYALRIDILYTKAA